LGILGFYSTALLTLSPHDRILNKAQFALIFKPIYCHLSFIELKCPLIGISSKDITKFMKKSDISEQFF
jgi:hypothetical protein